MGDRVVVGIDGSDIGQLALQWAARFAAGHGAVLAPILVWDAPRISKVPYPGQGPEPDFQADYEAATDALVGEVRDGPGDLTVEPARVVRGDPADELCAHAQGADLLVVGSRGLGGFSSLVLGSVSRHCVNHAPCPVAVVPDSYDPDAATSGLWVVGVDGSAHADHAVAWADRWAPAAATLRLVHAWQPPITLDRHTTWIDPEVCQITAQQIADAAAAKVDAHRAEPVAVRTDARADLPRLAADAGADVLVIGARGHRGIGRVLLGSVASSTLHALTVPTVVVR